VNHHCFRSFYCLLLLVLLFSSCKWFSDTDSNASHSSKTHEQPAQIVFPEFNTDSAFSYIVQQVKFGPRVPNTKGHEACAEWMIEWVKKYADTYYVQKFDAVAYDGTILKSINIIASVNPLAKKRILLAAHWDTRPFADQDTERPNEPILGANDGASGVAVLFEILRAMKTQPLQNIGVDFLFLDSEDYGQPANSKTYTPDSYCLGSQHWSRVPHVPGYKADFGILLDMVGAPGATFTREGTSAAYAGWVQDRVWKNAQILGYENYFLNQLTDPIVDDHKYINERAKIPTIDIIHHDPSTPTGFGSFWHTHQDNLSAIDKNTLKVVGRTVLRTVYEYDEMIQPL
jgi:hypothetical protein